MEEVEYLCDRPVNDYGKSILEDIFVELTGHQLN
jgi:hypothetical protein